MTVITNRNGLARAFYRLTGTSSDNGALIEHDSVTGETVNQLLQYGLWDAQRYLIDHGMGSRWITTTSLATGWTTDAEGSKYWSLPADFMRLAGDRKDPAIRRTNGLHWGREIDYRDRMRHRGDRYYTRAGKLWVTKNANLSTDLVLEYHARHATMTATGAIDFPADLLPLVAAYAADRGKDESWFPGDQEMSIKIMSTLRAQKERARLGSRESQQPKTRRIRPGGGTHYW